MSKRLAPTWVEIDLKALQHNFAALRAKLPTGCKTLAVVKSNAYGHGAVEVARALPQADAFGVGTIDEGIELRLAGIKRPILILLGIIGPYLEELVRHQLTPVLYDLAVAEQLNAFLEQKGQSLGKLPLEVHLKVDTGMTRLGFLPDAAPAFFAGLAKLSHLRPVGLLSHLADAGNQTATKRQIQEMVGAWQEFVGVFPYARYYHLANSLASIDGEIAHGNVSPRQLFQGNSFAPLKLRGALVDSENPTGGISRQPETMARLGIALYGAYPLPSQKSKIDLQPVMHWKSRLVSVKKVPKGRKVSYGGTFTTKRASLIGVIPVGYADGYFRSLSNQADILIGGRRVPLIGNICMDMMMVDVTALPGVTVGSEVVLIGRQGKKEIRAEELAELAGTISYEVFCRVAPRLERRYV